MSAERRTHALAVLLSSEATDWYTPLRVIRLARLVLGAIDLDPASCSDANETVGATRYYTQAEDGLLQSWACATLFLNPPFGVAIDPWIERLDAAYRSGEVGAAVLLVPARVDTAWFRRLRDYPVCFVHGRLRFSGTANSAPFPTAIFYLGTETDRFETVFGTLGDIYVRRGSVQTGGKQLLLGLEVV